MSVSARLAHVNLVARDWEGLAEFYERVLGFTLLPPVRRLRGRWLERATGVPGAEIEGVHLRFPGSGADGPTLEVFGYRPSAERPATAVNRPGFAHIALAVDDVQAARDAVVAAGGSTVGELASADIPGAGTVTFVYVTDPEGNVIELQRWSQ
ncbi:MAG: VOC family protein [Armatimonadota bacterium]